MSRLFEMVKGLCERPDILHTIDSWG